LGGLASSEAIWWKEWGDQAGCWLVITERKRGKSWGGDNCQEDTLDGE